MRAPFQVLIIPYRKTADGLRFCVFHRSDRDIWQFVSGGGEDDEAPPEAARRELFEETGIRAPEEDFELIDSARGRDTFFDFYCLERRVALRDIVLLPGETDDVMWASFDRVHAMIRRGQISAVIAAQFIRQEAALKARQNIQK